MARRADIEEYKQLVRAYDALPPRRGLTLLRDDPDKRYTEAWDAIAAHPLDKRNVRSYINTIQLARAEIRREDAGEPYWGVPSFSITIIDRGYEIDVTYPRPYIKKSNDTVDYGRDDFFRRTEWGIARLKKKQTKRWDKYARRLIKLGVYDKEVGWPDADDS